MLIASLALCAGMIGAAYPFIASAISAPATGTVVTAYVVPQPPVIGTATAGDRYATVTFTAPADDGGSPVTGYVVTSNPAGGQDQSMSASPHTILGLVNGTRYTFTVRAINAAGSSEPSLPSNAVYPAVPPEAPTNVVAVAGFAQATVSFSAPASDGGSPITSYKVVASNGQGVDQSGSLDLTRTITGLTNGASYTFRVFATNSAGNGGYSVESNVVVPGGPPDAPAKPTAVPGNKLATVSFLPPPPGGFPVMGYTVISSPVGGVDGNAGSASLSHVVTGLTNGTAYTFQVVASNQFGDGAPSPASAAVSPKPDTLPGAPVIGQAVAGNAQATVNFSPPADDGGTPVTGYLVTAAPAGGTDMHAGTLSPSHVITGLSNGVNYSFTVKAINAVGVGAASAPSNSIVPSAGLTSDRVLTIAGGAYGNGIQATDAVLSEPNAVATDASGNLYIVDRDNHRIRKVTTAGVISTFAGDGVTGFSGDGGPAIAARLNFPSDIAIDGAGNFYIADSGNNRIRKVDPAGNISTVAGTGSAASGGDAGLAINASLNNPQGVLIRTGGLVYVAETGGHRVRRFTLGGTISTIAGNGTATYAGDAGPATSASLNQPTALAADAAGNLYIADTNNHRIRMITAGGVISTVMGNGDRSCRLRTDALGTSTVAPRGLALGADGSLYVSHVCSDVLRLKPDGLVEVHAGRNGWPGFSGDGASATAGMLYQPAGISMDSGGILHIADALGERVRKVSSAGILSTVAGTGAGGDGTAALGANVSKPNDVAFDRSGNMYIAERTMHRVRRVSPEGIISTVAGTGIPGFSGDGGPATSAQLEQPYAVAVDAAGRLYIVDRYNVRIRKVDLDGTISTVAGSGASGSTVLIGQHPLQAHLSNPLAIAVDSVGFVYISTPNYIHKIVPDVSITTIAGVQFPIFGSTADNVPAADAWLGGVFGLAIDADDSLLIADSVSNRVRRLKNGMITTVAGSYQVPGTFSGDGGPATAARLNAPWDIAVDPAGNLYISDWGNHRIRRVSPSGTIETVVGTSMRGFSAESAEGAEMLLAQPTGLAVDPAGNLAIADTLNNRIRRLQLPAVQPPGPPLMEYATAGMGRATIRFAPPASAGGAPILGYTVTSYPAGGVDSNAGGLGREHVVTGLANGIAYTFTVKAASAAGTSPPSAASNAVVPLGQALSVADASVLEGAAGTHLATFTITLSAPASTAVGFDIATEPGTAMPGLDYTSTSLAGQVIAAGQTSASFAVPIHGDLDPEADETFTVTLRDVVGAMVLDGQGLGTIRNDDQATLSIADASVVEGNSGRGTATFVVSLSSPMSTPVSFDVATWNASATAGSDYVARSQEARVIDAGRTRAVFEVSVNGDALAEADETFTVQVGNVLGAVLSDGNAVGTIQNDDGSAITSIAQIQGRGPVSPLQGASVETEGTVTALVEGGFFLQTADARQDGDPATAEALFVASADATVRVGDELRVSGSVQETRTGSPEQLTLTTLVTARSQALARAQALPRAVALDARYLRADAALTALEPLEGMRVRLPQLRVVGPAGGVIDPARGRARSDGRFHGVLPGVARPFVEPGLPPFDFAPAAGNGGARFDGNPERLRIHSLGQRGALALSTDVGDTVTGLEGVLGYADGDFQLLPDPSAPIGIVSGARPRAVSEATPAQATLGSLSLRPFFDDVRGGVEPAMLPTAYATRLAKTANAICAYARSPDLLAIQGLENGGVLSDLAGALNARDGNQLFPGSCSAAPDYRWHLASGQGAGPKTGLLLRSTEVRPGVPRVELVSLSTALAGETFRHVDGSRQPLHAQPPLLARVRINAADGSALDLQVVSARLTAMDGEPGTTDLHGWRSRVDYLRALRDAQARSLATLVRSRQLAHPGQHLVVLGNFETSEFGDGRNDTMGLLTGQETIGGGRRGARRIVDPPLANLMLATPRSERYTVNRGGNAQAVDHVLVSQGLAAPGFAAHVEMARINADFGEDHQGDASLPMRVSDHDPVVLFLRMP